MHARIAFGLAILMAATSCVGQAVEHVSTATRVAAASAGPRLRGPVMVPAGPPPALLATTTRDPGPTIAVDLLAAPPFLSTFANPVDAQRALECLTAAIYYEARSESIGGQQAVAQVVLNRVRNPAFPDSVCGTVFEGASRSTGCQFSFTCDGSMQGRRNPTAWDRARRIAAEALAGFVYTPVGRATYYHTTAVHPWWDAKVQQVAHIGAHVFFQLPGVWGNALAFGQRYGGVEPTPAVAVRAPEKAATEGFIEAIEAGVTIHRAGPAVAPVLSAGTVSARPAVVRTFGVDIHRGGVTAPVTNEGGVAVHRGADEA